MYKRALRNLLMILSMTVCMGVVSGCTLGVKKQTEMLFISPVPIPEAVKGAPVIAENRKIRLAVMDRPDTTYTQKVTGYVLVDPWFYDKLIKNWNSR
jgi:hypothetical protein